MAPDPSPEFRVFAAELKERRDALAFGVQLKQGAQEFTDELLAVLFPHFCRVKYHSTQEIEDKLATLMRDLGQMIRPLVLDGQGSPEAVGAAFRESLPDIHAQLCATPMRSTPAIPRRRASTR